MTTKLFTLKILLLVLFLSGNSIGIYAQSFAWAKSMGGFGDDDYATSVTVDASGNVYTTGYFFGVADFDPGPGVYNLTSANFGSQGGYDVFISKLDASGNLVWAKNMGGLQDDNGYSIAVDASGNVYTTGSFNGGADFDPGPGVFNLFTHGFEDIFISKLDSSGNFVWAKSIGGPSLDYGLSIAADASGNVYTTGYFRGSVDFDPGTDTFNMTSTGQQDIFISKLDSSGNFVWAKSMGGTGGDQAQSITLDISGNVYTTGYFSGTADFDPGAGIFNLTSGSADVFISKLDSSGNFVWAKNIGGTMGASGSSITLDASGNVYTAGGFNGTADFDPGSGTYNLTATGYGNMFISKLNSSGDFVWAKAMGGTGTTGARSIAVNASNVYTTGLFSNTTDFNPGADSFNVTSNGGLDIFISRLDTAGNFVWAANIGGLWTPGAGGNGVDMGTSIALDTSGNVYTTGNFGGQANSTVDFDPGTDPADTFYLTSQNNDIYVLKLDCGDTSLVAITATADCAGYLLGNMTYTSTGHYVQKFRKSGGCDSTVALDLTINTDLEVHITVNVHELGTTLSYVTYQWFKNGIIIPGATDPTYTVTENADYQVAVTNEHDCTDTSAIYTVTNATGTEDIRALAKQISIYPNPSDDIIHIQSPVLVNIAITGIEGRRIRQVKNARSLSIKDLAVGVYLFRITDKTGALIKVEKVVKQ